jgi:hypothetical protein
MVKKFNLSEAAAEILNKSVSSARTKQDGPSRLPTSVVAGQKEVGDIGTEVTKTTDAGPDASKGVATATPPGATPPVGAEPMKKLKGQPAEQGSVEHPEGKPGRQMMDKNKGATFETYHEETEEDEDALVAEAEDKEEGHEDEKEDKALIKKMVKKTSMKEDIDALMQGESLSEEFVQKATTIFEAAVMSRVESIVEEIEAEYEQQFDAAITELKEDFAAKIDDYLNYVVQEWMEENQLAIESGLKSEIVEDFMVGLHKLFTEHYIDLPEEKVDAVEELAGKVEELEGELNEQIHTAIELKKELNEYKKIQAVQAVCEGLTQTQVEKLKSLAESIEFTSEEDFTEKLSTLKEAYAPSTVKAAEKSALEEGVEIPEDKPTKVSADPLVDAVAKTISKSVLK